VKSVKQIIKTEKEWKAKLEREIFSDADIQKARGYLLTLFQYENS
jgi:type I restriction enzyme S subunit